MSQEENEAVRAWMDAIQSRDLGATVSLADDGTPFRHTEQAEGLDLEALAAAMEALQDATDGPTPDDAGPVDTDASTEAPWLQELVRDQADRGKS